MEQCSVQYLKHIPVAIPEKRILVRLGYHNNKTVISPKQKQYIMDVIFEGSTLCDPAGSYLRLPIIKNNSRIITLKNNMIIHSQSLCKLLADSQEVIIMAATVGKEIIEAINKVIKEEGAKAAILDAVGSEIADSVLDWLMNFINTNIRRENLMLTKNRFSPGYGDLSLETQKQIYDLLSLKKMGISLTDSMMMVPEKSVTAIAGVEVI